MIPGMKDKEGATGTVTLSVRSVLVVDEAAPVRRKLLDILHRAGVPAGEISLVENADDALESFARSHASLVFTELVESPERGLEMVLEMLSLDPHVKIVLVTAEEANSPAVRAAIRAGVFGVVRKPLRHEAIRSILSEIEAEEGGIERYR